MLAALNQMDSSPSTMLIVAKRELNSTGGQFMPLVAEGQVVRDYPENQILVSGVTQLDGQYIILVKGDSYPVPQGIYFSSTVWSWLTL
jgi:hypothetical protein